MPEPSSGDRLDRSWRSGGVPHRGDQCRLPLACLVPLLVSSEVSGKAESLRVPHACDTADDDEHLSGEEAGEESAEPRHAAGFRLGVGTVARSMMRTFPAAGPLKLCTTS